MDVTVTVGTGMSRTPGATVEILDKLAATNVTADNWELLAAMLDYLDIPQKQEIVEGWREKFRPSVPQDVIAALGSDHALLMTANGQGMKVLYGFESPCRLVNKPCRFG